MLGHGHIFCAADYVDQRAIAHVDHAEQMQLEAFDPLDNASMLLILESLKETIGGELGASNPANMRRA